MKQVVLSMLLALLLQACMDKPQPATEEYSSEESNTVQPNSEEPITKQSSTDTGSYFTWATELCKNKGAYNSELYSPKQLQNTYNLWYTHSGILLETAATAKKVEEITKLDTAILTAEYSKKKRYFEELAVVNSAYWQQLKKLTIQELADEYELKKITIQAYSDLSVLENNRFSPVCPDVVQALTSADTAEVFSYWKAFTEKQSQNNGFPEQYMENFYKKYYSPDKLMHAKMDLLTYGWWNCANHTLTYINRDMQMEEEFNKLFSTIQSECDEP